MSYIYFDTKYLIIAIHKLKKSALITTKCNHLKKQPLPFRTNTDTKYLIIAI